MNKFHRWLRLYLSLFSNSIFFGFAQSAAAFELQLHTLDVNGHPVANTVVYAEPESPAQFEQAPGLAVMDQQNKAFVPHVLAVPLGTLVDFPNTDSVNHYVYSFSPIKSFQFKLFKNDLTQHQVRFDKPGLVTLGCNIHDFMLGYIFVAPTPFVGVSNSEGIISLQLPDTGVFTLHTWQELADENLDKLDRRIEVPQNQSPLVISFQRPLKSPRLLHPENNDY